MNTMCVLIASTMLYCGGNNFRPNNDVSIYAPYHYINSYDNVSCMFDSDIASDGSYCGGRSAESRLGGCNPYTGRGCR